LFANVIVLKADCHADGRVALRPNFDAGLTTRPLSWLTPAVVQILSGDSPLPRRGLIAVHAGDFFTVIEGNCRAWSFDSSGRV
jgi:hypothetical protein